MADECSRSLWWNVFPMIQPDIFVWNYFLTTSWNIRWKWLLHTRETSTACPASSHNLPRVRESNLPWINTHWGMQRKMNKTIMTPRDGIFFLWWVQFWMHSLVLMNAAQENGRSWLLAKLWGWGLGDSCAFGSAGGDRGCSVARKSESNSKYSTSKVCGVRSASSWCWSPAASCIHSFGPHLQTAQVFLQ